MFKPAMQWNSSRSPIKAGFLQSELDTAVSPL
jgi:hypothetical protein